MHKSVLPWQEAHIACPPVAFPQIMQNSLSSGMVWCDGYGIRGRNAKECPDRFCFLDAIAVNRIRHGITVARFVHPHVGLALRPVWPATLATHAATGKVFPVCVARLMRVVCVVWMILQWLVAEFAVVHMSYGLDVIKRDMQNALNDGSSVRFLLIPKSTTDTMAIVLSDVKEVWCDECSYNAQFDEEHTDDAHAKLRELETNGCPNCGVK